MNISSPIRIKLDAAYALIQRGWEIPVPELFHRGEGMLIEALLKLWDVPEHDLTERREEFIEQVEKARSLHG